MEIHLLKMVLPGENLKTLPSLCLYVKDLASQNIRGSLRDREESQMRRMNF